jgi:perosamine synthetase
MLVTNNKKIFDTCLTLSNHGRTRLNYKYFKADRIGFKYKMTNMQAALGISQLKKLEIKLKKKKKYI